MHHAPEHISESWQRLEFRLKRGANQQGLLQGLPVCQAVTAALTSGAVHCQTTGCGLLELSLGLADLGQLLPACYRLLCLQNSGQVDWQEASASAIGLIIAGNDTSGLGVTALLATLPFFPEVLQKLKKEQQQVNARRRCWWWMQADMIVGLVLLCLQANIS